MVPRSARISLFLRGALKLDSFMLIIDTALGRVAVCVCVFVCVRLCVCVCARMCVCEKEAMMGAQSSMQEG